MQVNSNVPIKTLYTIRLVLSVALALMAAGIMLTFLQAGRYVKTQGIVADVHTMARMNSVSKGEIVHYIEYTYEVEGQTLRGSTRTLLPGRRYAGDRVTVYYDPRNPQRTMNLFVREGLIIGLIFFGIFLVFLQKVIAVRRHM